MHIKVKDFIRFAWQQVIETLNQTRCPSSQLSWWENSSTLHPKNMGVQSSTLCTASELRFSIISRILQHASWWDPTSQAFWGENRWSQDECCIHCNPMPWTFSFGGLICFDMPVCIIYLTTHFQWYWGFLRLPQSCNIRQGLASHFGWWLGRVRKMAGEPLNRQPKPKLSYACS